MTRDYLANMSRREIAEADLAGLSRRGCVRFALACAGRVVRASADRQTLEAVRAWLACPCPRCAALAVAAAEAAYKISRGTLPHFAAANASYATSDLIYTHRAWRAANCADDAVEPPWQRRTLAVVRIGDRP